MFRHSTIWLLFFCLVTMLAGRAVRSAGVGNDPLKQKVEINISNENVSEAFASIVKKENIRLVLEIPNEPKRVTLKQGVRTLDKALDELAAAIGAVREDRQGIMVFRPKALSAPSTWELRYRESLRGVAEFLEELDPDQRDAIAREDLLDYKLQSAQQRKRVREALYDNRFEEKNAVDWMENRRMTVGFIFDPYVEIAGDAKELPERTFIRTQFVYPAYGRLIQGEIAGTFKPAFEKTKP